MISSVGRRLRIAFDRHPSPTEAPTRFEAPSPPVDFVAFGEDYLLSGRVRLSAERLTDMLDADDEYQLLDVLVERLDDGTAVEAAEAVVRRDELLLVQAAGPRGSIDRRRRTRAHPLAAQVGPYLVRGYLHTAPGHDPLLAIRRRGVMVPLTEAIIELVIGGVHEARPAGTVVVNRDWLEWVAPALDLDVEAAVMPDLPFEVAAGPLVKDFTGEIRRPPERFGDGSDAPARA